MGRTPNILSRGLNYRPTYTSGMAAIDAMRQVERESQQLTDPSRYLSNRNPDCKVTRVVATTDLFFPSTTESKTTQRKIPKGEVLEVIQTVKGKYLRIVRTGDLFVVKTNSATPSTTDNTTSSQSDTVDLTMTPSHESDSTVMSDTNKHTVQSFNNGPGTVNSSGGSSSTSQVDALAVAAADQESSRLRSPISASNKETPVVNNALGMSATTYMSHPLSYLQSDQRPDTGHQQSFPGLNRSSTSPIHRHHHIDNVSQYPSSQHTATQSHQLTSSAESAKSYSNPALGQFHHPQSQPSHSVPIPSNTASLDLAFDQQRQQQQQHQVLPQQQQQAVGVSSWLCPGCGRNPLGCICNRAQANVATTSTEKSSVDSSTAFSHKSFGQTPNIRTANPEPDSGSEKSSGVVGATITFPSSMNYNTAVNSSFYNAVELNRQLQQQQQQQQYLRAAEEVARQSFAHSSQQQQQHSSSDSSATSTSVVQDYFAQLAGQHVSTAGLFPTPNTATAASHTHPMAAAMQHYLVGSSNQIGQGQSESRAGSNFYANLAQRQFESPAQHTPVSTSASSSSEQHARSAVLDQQQQQQQQFPFVHSNQQPTPFDRLQPHRLLQNFRFP